MDDMYADQRDCTKAGIRRRSMGGEREVEESRNSTDDSSEGIRRCSKTTGNAALRLELEMCQPETNAGENIQMEV